MPASQRTPFHRARHDPAFLRAVAERLGGDVPALDALRWLDDPAAPGQDGRPGPGAAVEAARAALYAPGADAAMRERHRRLAAELAEEQDRTRAVLERVAAEERARPEPVRNGPPPDAAQSDLPRPRRRRTRLRTLVAAGGIAALVLGAALAWAQQRAPQPTGVSSAAAARLPLARLLAAEPERLPAAWHGAALVTSSDVLDGAAPLSAPDGHRRSRLLLVVRCPATDRSFQAVVVSDTSVAPQYGACGRLQALALPPRLAGPVQVVVTTRGVQPFSGALLQR